LHAYQRNKSHTYRVSKAANVKVETYLKAEMCLNDKDEDNIMSKLHQQNYDHLSLTI